MSWDEEEIDDFFDDMYLLGMFDENSKSGKGQKTDGSCLIFLVMLSAILITPIAIAFAVLA